MSTFERLPPVDKLIAAQGSCEEAITLPGKIASQQRLPSLESLLSPQTGLRDLLTSHDDRKRLRDDLPSYRLGLPSQNLTKYRRSSWVKHDEKAVLEDLGPDDASRNLAGGVSHKKLQSAPASTSLCHQSGDQWCVTPNSRLTGERARSEERQISNRNDCAQLTPVSSNASEVEYFLTDGLGPKIWTGSRFLPRFVRVANVPGEGECFFYDDGSHCKRVIDGEVVNAYWGVTKAGKPRKRLAIACVTCRKKKIKCDPGFPRCLQCEKFDRVCGFKNAPRGGNSFSPSTAAAELVNVHDLEGSVTNFQGPTHNVDDSSPSSSRAELASGSVENNSKKRLRLDFEAYACNGGQHPTVQAPIDRMKHPGAAQEQSRDTPSRIADEGLLQTWRTDPFKSGTESINDVLTNYFEMIDDTLILQLLPEEPFRAWLTQERNKSSEDLMVLYSVLAVGAVLSRVSKHFAFEYARVANFAQISIITPCLQVVQCRILLAVYHFATGGLQEATKLVASAFSTAACLQLNQEIERTKTESFAFLQMGMSDTGYREARRRTSWSLFMLERFFGTFTGHLNLMDAENMYIRFPINSERFNQQVDAFVPIFDPGESIASQLIDSHLNITGCLIEILHIWAACRSAVCRLAAKSSPTAADAARGREIAKRVQDWYGMLPSHLAFSSPNMESAASRKKLGIFLTMHLLYHETLIRLHRYHLPMTQTAIDSKTIHVAICRDHARSILEIANSFNRRLCIRPHSPEAVPPVMSAATIAAVDVLTAQGEFSSAVDLIENIRTAKTAVDRMARIWEHAVPARVAIEQRLQKLIRIYLGHENHQDPRSEFGVVIYRGFSPAASKNMQWQILYPMEKSFRMDMDVIYANVPLNSYADNR